MEIYSLQTFLLLFAVNPRAVCQILNRRTHVLAIGLTQIERHINKAHTQRRKSDQTFTTL